MSVPAATEGSLRCRVIHVFHTAHPSSAASGWMSLSPGSMSENFPHLICMLKPDTFSFLAGIDCSQVEVKVHHTWMTICVDVPSLEKSFSSWQFIIIVIIIIIRLGIIFLYFSCWHGRLRGHPVGLVDLCILSKFVQSLRISYTVTLLQMVAQIAREKVSPWSSTTYTITGSYLFAFSPCQRTARGCWFAVNRPHCGAFWTANGVSDHLQGSHNLSVDSDISCGACYKTLSSY